jgi:23S rRNA (pseudouridine1915-N3)-methyltransferase
MRIRIVAIGHRMPAWVDAACGGYAKRLPRDYAFSIVELKPASRDRGRTVAQILDEEAARIAAASEGATIVALDERGSGWTTRELATRLARWRDEAADVAFVIGSADGLAESLKSRASVRLSLSAMTLPHALARVMLIEQLYRVAAIDAGHPYHRE